ncbi:anthrone oxygenase family protein [Sorangium sp. So ce1128]
MLVPAVMAIALLSTGLMAGAFGYGAVNLVPTFAVVPLEMRLSFHAELMKMNSPVMQTAMASATFSALALAALMRGSGRWIALGAGLLAVASFVITRLGNVPINARIKEWAVSSAPADHAEILWRWEMYNVMRTVTALAAFILLVILAVRGLRERPTAPKGSARRSAEPG